MIRTLNEALATFDHHQPSPDQIQRIMNVRFAAKVFVGVLWAMCPDSADRTVAIRKVHEAMMTANKSIVLEDEAT
jgi:hypothetical protein